MTIPRLGAQAALAVSHRGGAGTHADRRTRRRRSKTAQKRAAIQDQRA